MSIPTAEEVLNKEFVGTLNGETYISVLNAMKIFTRICVSDALNTAGDKAIQIQTPDKRKYVSKKAIIASYSLENIK